MKEAFICVCPHCATKNRIATHQMNLEAKCGRCHKPFSPQACQKEVDSVLTLRCHKCRTRNRVPVSKLSVGLRCGRCAAVLHHKDVYNGRTVMVTDGNFSQTILDSPLPALLYAWAPWCSVCSSTGPQVEQIASETKGKIRVAKVNIEANPRLAAKYQILSVPNFFIFDAGQLKEQMPGAVSKHDLLMKMAHFI